MKREIWIININCGDGRGWQHCLEEFDQTRAVQRLKDERDWSKRMNRKDKYRLTRYVPESKKAKGA